MGLDRDELVKAWLREERQPFAGWDFSYLKGRFYRNGQNRLRILRPKNSSTSFSFSPT